MSTSAAIDFSVSQAEVTGVDCGQAATGASGDARLGDRGVLRDLAAGDTDRADDAAVADERQTATKAHQAAVGDLDVVQVATGLRQLADRRGRHLEEGGSPRLPDRDVDGAQ